MSEDFSNIVFPEDSWFYEKPTTSPDPEEQLGPGYWEFTDTTLSIAE